MQFDDKEVFCFEFVYFRKVVAEFVFFFLILNKRQSINCAMNLIIGDSLHDLAALRLNQIQQFPQIKLLQDDIHSNCSICISCFIKDEIILILPCVVSSLV